MEKYDYSGKLISIYSSDGQSENLSYNGSKLTQITDSFGRSINFIYDTSNRILKLTQPDSGEVTFFYDTANNLNKITYPDGKSRIFHYEDSNFPNALTGITDEKNIRYAAWSYDSQGRAISSQHAGGADLTTLSYGSGTTTVTDAFGTARVTTLQTVLDVVRGSAISQPDGSGCSAAFNALTYDANGNVASRTDFNTNKTCYVYDTARNLETKRVEALTSGAVCATVLTTPPSPTMANPVRTINTQWHSYWRLPVMVAEPLKITTYVYNGDTYSGSPVTCAPGGATVPTPTGTQPIGVLCKKVEQATTDTTGSSGFSATPTGTPRIWDYTYNLHGQVLTADGPRTDLSDVTTYTYFADNNASLGKRGNVDTITNALSQVTSITSYDDNGRPLTIVDPNSVTTTLTYAPRGWLTSKAVAGETTTYTYDDAGQLTLITLPDNSTLAYTWDTAHRLTQITDALGNKVIYTLDAMGNRTQEDVKDPSNVLAQTRTRVFDALNRLWKDIGATSPSTQITTYAYDANGNRTSTTDPLTHVTANGYDALNRLIAITDPNSGVTSLAYNGQDRTVQVTDPRTLNTTYTVDGLGNLTQQVSPRHRHQRQSPLTPPGIGSPPPTPAAKSPPTPTTPSTVPPRSATPRAPPRCSSTTVAAAPSPTTPGGSPGSPTSPAAPGCNTTPSAAWCKKPRSPAAAALPRPKSSNTPTAAAAAPRAI